VWEWKDGQWKEGKGWGEEGKDGEKKMMGEEKGVGIVEK